MLPVEQLPYRGWQTQVPDSQARPPQQSAPVEHAPAAGAQAHTPFTHEPVQQFASLPQSEPGPLHAAQTPLAHTPLQHWTSAWQLFPGSLQTHVPALQAPLQHEAVAQLRPLVAHEPPPPPPPVPPEAPPVPPPPPGTRQAPCWHVCGATHTSQRPAEMPHAVASVPAAQVPSSWQQPVQVAALHDGGPNGSSPQPMAPRATSTVRRSDRRGMVSLG